MPRARSIVAVVGALVVLAGPWLAATTRAADLAEVSGTVTSADATPAAGVAVAVSVAGSDAVHPATTDETGAFSVQVELQAGDTIEVRATGPTVSTDPDAEGCVSSETPTGHASLTVAALPPEPIVVVLDGTIQDRVCAATASPEPAAITAPPTDAPGRGAPSAGAGPVLVVLGVLALAAAVAIAAGVSPRRRPSRTRG